MPIKTPFSQTAVTPEPFKLGLIPASNITKIPDWQLPSFVNGTAPAASPAIGLQPITLKALLSSKILPQKK